MGTAPAVVQDCALGLCSNFQVEGNVVGMACGSGAREPN